MDKYLFGYVLRQNFNNFVIRKEIEKEKTDKYLYEDNDINKEYKNPDKFCYDIINFVDKDILEHNFHHFHEDIKKYPKKINTTKEFLYPEYGSYNKPAFSPNPDFSPNQVNAMLNTSDYLYKFLEYNVMRIETEEDIKKSIISFINLRNEYIELNQASSEFLKPYKNNNDSKIIFFEQNIYFIFSVIRNNKDFFYDDKDDKKIIESHKKEISIPYSPNTLLDEIRFIEQTTPLDIDIDEFFEKTKPEPEKTKSKKYKSKKYKSYKNLIISAIVLFVIVLLVVLVVLFIFLFIHYRTDWLNIF